MPKDLVCGMEITKAEAAATSQHKGTTYYFCAPGCKKTFDHNPKNFLKDDPKAQNPSDRNIRTEEYLG